MRNRRTLLVALITLALSVIFAGTASAARIVYDNFEKKGGYSLSDYNAKWSNPYGPLDMGQPPGDTRSFTDGTFYIDDAPFRSSFDFSVFDHLKYIGTSNQSFPVPARGSVEFSSQIAAVTPGTISGYEVNGTYGPPGSYPNGSPYTDVPLQGQQAGAVMNMVDFCTGQLFDWFISGDTAFTLIERLPTSVTGNTSVPGCGDNYAGPNEMYTQIIREVPIKPGTKHTVSIRYTRTPKISYVEYFLDGKLVSKAGNIGVPLDVQGVNHRDLSLHSRRNRRESSRQDQFVHHRPTGRSVSSMPSRTSGGGSTSIQAGRPIRWKLPRVVSVSPSRPPSESSARVCARTSTTSS
jgi:hypothetical protein